MIFIARLTLISFIFTAIIDDILSQTIETIETLLHFFQRFIRLLFFSAANALRFSQRDAKCITAGDIKTCELLGHT